MASVSEQSLPGLTTEVLDLFARNCSIELVHVSLFSRKTGLVLFQRTIYTPSPAKRNAELFKALERVRTLMQASGYPSNVALKCYAVM